MSFLVAGTLQVAAQLADAQDSLGRKGKYSIQGLRVALILSSPGASAATVAALDGVFQALGFENCKKREVSVQSFHEELILFREQLDAHGSPMGCALVALVAPSRQLRQPQLLIQELSHCKTLRGCPKVFLLLSSGSGDAQEPGDFLTGLGEICGRCPHWSLLQLLTEPDPGPSAQYDLCGARAALFLAVTRDRPGTQHDVAALGDLCQALGFKVTLRMDPTAQAFQEELAQFQERLDTHRVPVSCALVALMAHGGPRGQLLGADGQEVQPEVLVQELSCCRVLKGHPKIFLLQACRGGKRDPGVGPTALPWYWRWLRAPPTIPTQADVLQVYVNTQDSLSQDSTSGRCDHADILTIYAATEGCVAYRDEKGSDFIQTLVDVVRAKPGGDILDLLTEVNRRVCELDVLGPDCNDPRKACLEIRSSLRRRLCLQA
uniref:Caspase-14-like isoform X3 n=1 Tax=Castor canadensis TaxID=51338 RepID=A0A8B7V9E1_CASCN|nr:caspase-14-like isoform X3 [Castor canadensis]